MKEAWATGARTRARPEEGAEYLSFRLGNENYGIDILKVQEIRGYEEPTFLANAPEFIKGVIDLRGTIVPILDLRIRFGLPRRDHDEFTVVIILHVAQRMVGLVVDAVSDVIALADDDVKSVPAFSSSVFDSKYITGIGTVQGDLVILLDIVHLVSSSVMGLVEDTIAA